MWSKRHNLCAIQAEVLRRLWRFLLLPFVRRMHVLNGRCSFRLGSGVSGRMSSATAHGKKYMFVVVSHWDVGMFNYYSKAMQGFVCEQGFSPSEAKSLQADCCHTYSFHFPPVPRQHWAWSLHLINTVSRLKYLSPSCYLPPALRFSK